MTINEKLTKLETKMDENSATLRRVDEAIYGNGKQGLLADMAVLAKSFNDHLAAHRQSKIDWKWLATTLAAIAAAIAAFFK